MSFLLRLPIRALGLRCALSGSSACRSSTPGGTARGGGSAGAAAVAALEVASNLERGVIVLVFPDSGTRYLSESFLEEHDPH